MKYVSTRHNSPDQTLAGAIVAGLAPDGGLYIPDDMPSVDAESLVGASQVEVGQAVLEAFRDDASPDTAGAIAHAYRDRVELVDIGRKTSVLELYWGASAAFKDYGAQFLGEYLPTAHAAINDAGSQRVTVMVATSGDTGGAVAAAFWRKPGVDVYVLYPKGRVSARQEHQLCCWGENVQAVRVDGSFDECQALVKGAFRDPFWTEGRFLTSANSINVGRLLPQVVYYCWSSLAYRSRHGATPNYVVPTGNLGNALACVWARTIGFPIGEIVLATNANETLFDYYENGEWEPRASIATLANAMDVGTPSNMERLRALYPDHTTFTDQLRVVSVDDSTIENVIRDGEDEWGRVWDPHTACAVHARETIGGDDWVLAATAHPAKFETVVEPLVGHEVELPPALTDILERPTQRQSIAATAEALRSVAK